ncbi:MAG TPA: hypothetical protein VF518_03545 [Polyangia bacterium]
MSKRICIWIVLFAGAQALTACGSGGGSGQITEAWRPYCVATFTQDYAFKDGFGDELVTARKGEAYLMSDFSDSFGKDTAELVYLGQTGPSTLDIQVTLGSRAFPFTSNCAFDDTLPYYAVFSNVSVYQDVGLTSKLCDLAADTVVPRDATRQAGFAATLGIPTLYEVYLNAFSARCGGAEVGYINVPQTQVFGATTWLVPILAIIGPK